MLRWIFGLLLVLFVSSTSYAFNEPCFDFACDSATQVCSFDPSCSVATPFIWKVSWDWGDGTGTPLTGPGVLNHTFPEGGDCFSYVTLTVFPWSNEVESVTCEVIHERCSFWPSMEDKYLSGRCTKDGVDYE